MEEFDAATRASAWWATDSRRAVSKQLNDVILEKRGQAERAEPRDREPMDMGLALQSSIGRIFSEITGLEVREQPGAGTHPREEWLRAHTDFETSDGGLLEVKNYNAEAIKRFSQPDLSEPLIIPHADMIQCIHEATVFQKPHVWLGVLFGGQRFRHYKIDVSDETKTAFLKQAAEWWARVQTGELAAPETVEQSRVVWPQDSGEIVVASAHTEKVVSALRDVKARIKELEAQESELVLAVQRTMADASILQAVDGEMLVTWKKSAGSKKFDERAFKSEFPEMHAQFIRPTEGFRRMLVK